MPISFACTQCGARFKAPDGSEGRRVKCTKCGLVQTVPAPVIVPEPASEPAPLGAPDAPAGESNDALAALASANAVADHAHDATRPGVGGRCPICRMNTVVPGAWPLYGFDVCSTCSRALYRRRAAAWIIDYVLLNLLSIPVFIFLMVQADRQRIGDQLYFLLAVLLQFILVCFVFNTKDGYAGYSIGKVLCGLRVIDDQTGKPIGPVASWMRNLPLLFPLTPIVIALTMGVGRRRGDGWAHTKVIWTKYRKSPVFGGALAAPPPALTPLPAVAPGVAAPPLSDSRCPVCRLGRGTGGGYVLYDVPVCRKCYSSVANRRYTAYLIDYVIFTVLSYGVGFMFGFMAAAQMLSIPESRLLALFICGIVIPLLFLFKDGIGGASLGKRACGLRVINATSLTPADISATVRRNLILLVPFAPLFLAFSLRKGNRFGDGWANTRVIWLRYPTSSVFTGKLICRGCGYNLTGNLSGKCPECGLVVTT